MNAAVIVSALMYLTGFGLVVAGVFLLVGLPWALLAAGALSVLIGRTISEGIRVAEGGIIQ